MCKKRISTSHVTGCGAVSSRSRSVAIERRAAPRRAAPSRADGRSKNANRKLMHSMRLVLFLCLSFSRVAFSIEPGVKRVRSNTSNTARGGQRDGGGGARDKQRARERWRTGTRGIQQLPLNVFNAAVEARKRPVGRSNRSAPRRSRAVGMEPCGPAGAERRCSRFVFLMDFSLSLYVPGGIAITGPVQHDGTSGFYESACSYRSRSIDGSGWTVNVCRGATETVIADEVSHTGISCAGWQKGHGGVDQEVELEAL